MRHGVKGRHLARTAEHRKALFKNLIAALFEHGRIRTTDAKAREIRPLAEKMVTLGKRGDLHARRQAVRVLGNGVAVERLFGPIAERFAARPGGYTRMVKAGRRHGDSAPIAYLELLEEAPRVVRTGAVEEEKDEGGSGRRRQRGTGAGTASKSAARPEARSRARGESQASKEASSQEASREEPAEEPGPSRGRKRQAKKEGREGG